MYTLTARHRSNYRRLKCMKDVGCTEVRVRIVMCDNPFLNAFVNKGAAWDARISIGARIQNNVHIIPLFLHPQWWRWGHHLFTWCVSSQLIIPYTFSGLNNLKLHPGISAVPLLFVLMFLADDMRIGSPFLTKSDAGLWMSRGVVRIVIIDD